jgi:hypothetical protein
MSKHLKITIPEPCHEGWENMTPSEKGRFCGSCQKQVVDFTRMSDSQMIVFFKQKANRNVCGHFEKNQLDHYIDIPKKRIPWVRYFFQFIIPAFLATRTVAQSPQLAVTAVQTQVDNNNIRGKVFVPRINGTVSGRVVDNEGKGVADVRISVQLTTDTTITDSDGNFKLEYHGNSRKLMVFASGDSLIAAPKNIKLSKRSSHVNGLQFIVFRRDPDVHVEGFINMSIKRK